MIFNDNLIFRNDKHFENFRIVMGSEFPNIYRKLCDGEKLETIEVGYYFILSSFLDSKFLLRHKLFAINYIQKDFLSQSEYNLLNFATQLLDRKQLDLSVLNLISDDDQVLLKTGFDIAYDELSITTDVLFELISTLHQNEVQITTFKEDYHLER